MSEDNEPNTADDPWLTLAEIADELRVNPATVRLWIRRGRLKAMRAGQRKLLVRRSELDRMLASADPSRSAPAQPRLPQPLRPVFDRRLQDRSPGCEQTWTASVIGDAIKKMQEAEAVFDTAVEASDNAPPDPGFPQRIRAVAQASLQRAEALAQAALIPGFRWTPGRRPAPADPLARAATGRQPSRPRASVAELRHGRRATGHAVQGNVLSLVAHEFREIGRVLNEIADALEPNAPTGKGETPALDDAPREKRRRQG